MPEMITILDGLAQGARSVVSILCLFFAVNIVYACVGTLFLGQRDPLHFGKFSASLLNLYSVTTLEWVDLLQTNLWGCIAYNTGDYELVQLNNNSEYMWDSVLLDGPAFTNDTHSAVYETAECAVHWGPWGQLLVVAYFFSFVIITVFVLFTMFMGAIAISMAKATESLEKKAALAPSRDQDWSLMHDMEPKFNNSFAAKYLLMPETVVDFETAEGLSYHEKFKSIENCDGGLVYLSFLDSNAKSRMENHSLMTQRLIWTFRYLMQVESVESAEVESVDTEKPAPSAQAQEAMAPLTMSQLDGALEEEPDKGGTPRSSVAGSLAGQRVQKKRKSWRSEILERMDSGGDPSGKQSQPVELGGTAPTALRRCTDIMLRAYATVSYTCFCMTQHWCFNFVVITVIFLVGVEYIDKAQQGNAALVAFLEDSSSMGSVLKISQWIFLAECIIKVLANGLQPWGYFRSYWNIFDFAILIIGFSQQPALLVARILRVFRIMEIVGGRARRNFEAFLTSILSFRVIGTLWMIVIFLYAVAGSHLFGSNDPFRFKNAGTAVMTLFWASTLDGLPELMFTNAYGCDSSFSNYGDVIDASECVAPEAQPQLTSFYFATFAIFSHGKSKK
jgi:hypothetical protein